MILILLLLSLPCLAEFTPLPATTQESTNKNFKDIDEEIRRLESTISSTASASGYLAGNNTWTGNNVFGASVTFSGKVSVSSTTDDIAGFAITQASYLVGIATVTLTVSGIHPIHVCTSGLAQRNAASEPIGRNFLYSDGVTAFFYGNLSTTIGWSETEAGGSGTESRPLDGCYYIKEGGIPSGTKSFTLLLKAPSAQVKLGYNGADSKVTEFRFWVEDVH